MRTSHSLFIFHHRKIMDKQKRFKLGVIVALVAVYCLLIQPIIMAIIGGLLGSVVALVIGFVVAALAPAFMEKMAHLKYGALKAVISRDPINALYRRLEERKKSQEEMRLKLVEQKAALERTRRKSDEMAKLYPAKKEQYIERLVGFERLYAYQVDMYKKVKLAVEAFALKMQEVEADYEMAMLFNETNQIMGGQEDFEKQLREKFAFDAIDREVDTAFANMSVALVDIDSAPTEVIQSPQHLINYDSAGRVVVGNILEPVMIVKQ